MKKITLFIFLFFVWTCSKDSPTKSEPVPQPPSVNNLNIVTNEETPVTFTMTGSDPEGSSITFSISTEPENGTLTVSGAAGTYTPKINYHGQDTFTYIASDGTLSSKAALVTVTINPVDDEPNAMDVSGVTNEDQSVILTLRAEEYDGDNISFSIKRDPYNGTVTISGNQATYTPNENYYGSDSFTFEAMDSNARSILNTATASITINPVNDAPTMESTDGESIQFSTLELNLTGTDLDGDNLTFYVSDDPLYGTVELDSNTLIYYPNTAWHGIDSLKVQAFDGYLYSEPVSINITFKVFFQSSPINYLKTGYENKHTELWLPIEKVYVDAGMNLFPIILDGFFSRYGLLESAGIADFNGDGFEDIIYAKFGTDDFQTTYGLELLINNQDNETFTFDNSLLLNKPSSVGPRESKISDLNNDGKPDFILAPTGIHNGTGGIPSILMSSNEGYNYSELELPRSWYHGLAVGDINNDNLIDLIFPDNYGSHGLYLMKNQGEGIFEISDLNDGSFDGIGNFELYDINKDGFLDLVASGFNDDPPWDNNSENENIGSTIGIFWGDGVSFSGQNFTSGSGYLLRGSASQDTVFWDLNNDGNEEIITVFFSDQFSYRNEVRVFEHDGSYNYSDQTDKFLENPSVGWDNQAIVWLRAQDIDNDGFVDIFASDKRPLEFEDKIPPHWEWDGNILKRK
jgi:hypothetical protein